MHEACGSTTQLKPHAAAGARSAHAGRRTVPALLPPGSVETTATRAWTPVPALVGQHTDAILARTGPGRRRPSPQAARGRSGVSAMRLPRSYLFVPGDRPERFDKALASGADAVVLDLEDAVAHRPPRMRRARPMALHGRIRPRYAGSRARVVVRINDEASRRAFDERRRACSLAPACIAAVMLPKAESHADQVQAASVPPCPARRMCCALVESARGIAQRAHAAGASTDGVTRLVFGTHRLRTRPRPGHRPTAALDAWCTRSWRDRRRRRVPQASQTPVAGVTHGQLGDEHQPARRPRLARARQHGFGAKLCVPPEAGRAHCMPRWRRSARGARAWAQRVLQAADGGLTRRRAQLDGRMIDQAPSC